MRVASVRGPLTLFTDNGGVDVEKASTGRFGADPQAVFAQWPAFRAWAASAASDAAVPVAEADLGSPAPLPTQVFGIGLNYRDHAAESGLPLPASPATFTKFPTCSVPGIIAELSAILPLLPGDVLFTGAPAGIGATRKPPRFLQPGEVLGSYVEGIGTLRNRFIAAATQG